MSDAIIMTDTKLHIRYWNDAAERLYGWNSVEVCGRNIRDILPLCADDVLSSIEDNGQLRCEGPQLRTDGSTVMVHAYATSIPDDIDEPILIVAVSRLTERQAA